MSRPTAAGACANLRTCRAGYACRVPVRWTAFVIRHRVAVLAVWVVAAGLAVWAATQLHDRLQTSFAVPGTESARAAATLEDRFGVRPDGTFTVVFPVAHPSDPSVRTRLQQRLDRAARAVPTGRATRLRAGGRVLFGDVTTTLDLQHAKRHTSALRRALRTPGSSSALVTGEPAIQHDLDPLLASDLRRGETLAVPIALAVLFILFGLSLAVAIPFAVAAGRDHGHARNRLPGRGGDAGGRLRPEPRRADRPRAGDRLLAARRVTVQGGARARAPAGRRAGGDDGDCRAGGSLLGARRRDRARPPLADADSVHTRPRSRGLHRPAGDNRGRPDPPPGAPVAPRRTRRTWQTARRGGHVGPDRADDHAPPGHVPRRRHGDPRRRRGAGALPPPHPGLDLRAPAVARGGPWLHDAQSPGRDRDRHADRDRRRRRCARCRPDTTGAGRGRPAEQGAGEGSRGLCDRDRPQTPVRRRERTVRARDRRRETRVRRARDAALRPSAARSDPPRGGSSRTAPGSPSTGSRRRASTSSPAPTTSSRGSLRRCWP